MELNIKGSTSGTSVAWIIRMILLLVIMMTIYAIISINLSRGIETNDIQREIIKSRFLYGPGCIIYSNENKDYPGIIDLNKLTNDQYFRCFDNSKLFGINLTISSNEKMISNSYYNKDIYDLKFSCKLNKPKYNCLESSDYLLYRDANGKINSGILIIDLVISK